MPAPNENSSEDRTEAPTQFRREEFRRMGHVALSKELLSVILLAVVGGALYFLVQSIFKEMALVTTHYFSFHQTKELTKSGVLQLSYEAIQSLGWMALPILGVSVIVGILACIAQIGVNFTTEPLSPRWDRLDPINGLKRMISWHGVVEAIKAIIKLAISLVVLWFFLKAQTDQVLAFFQDDPQTSIVFILKMVGQLFFTILIALAAMAALDFGFQRFQLEKQLKMTKKEARDEFKLREGDPLIRQRIRNIQRRMASQRMMESVPKSDVVVTNPTHISVALQYDADSMSSPKVVAKGAGHIALKIREMARSHQVPIVENKPLARTMYKEVEVNQYIPRELYKAVAEVLAYVYRLKRYERELAHA